METKTFSVVEHGNPLQIHTLVWEQDVEGNNRLRCAETGEESAWAAHHAFAFLPVAGFALFGEHWAGVLPVNVPVSLRSTQFQIVE